MANAEIPANKNAGDSACFKRMGLVCINASRRPLWRARTISRIPITKRTEARIYFHMNDSPYVVCRVDRFQLPPLTRCVTELLLSRMGKATTRSRLCPQKCKTFLVRVSTTCGSGWVMDPLHNTLGNRARLRRTHPLPQVVLTRSKQDA